MWLISQQDPTRQDRSLYSVPYRRVEPLMPQASKTGRRRGEAGAQETTRKTILAGKSGTIPHTISILRIHGAQIQNGVPEGRVPNAM